MSATCDIVLYCLPAVLFIPVLYVLLRYSVKPDPGKTDPVYPKSASLLMSCVLATLMVAWAWVGYAHFFGR